MNSLHRKNRPCHSFGRRLKQEISSSHLGSAPACTKGPLVVLQEDPKINWLQNKTKPKKNPMLCCLVEKLVSFFVVKVVLRRSAFPTCMTVCRKKSLVLTNLFLEESFEGSKSSKSLSNIESSWCVCVAFDG
uniref:Uncharacterized protein n=1 Tax=Micrurus surinamensis TaxID=129470 RepID=A0A2D4NYZ8_MICSU